MTDVRDDGRRFYVWWHGRKLMSDWRAYPPNRMATDCTNMPDDSFEEMMAELAIQEREINAPGGGDPGDPGMF